MPLFGLKLFAAAVLTLGVCLDADRAAAEREASKTLEGRVTDQAGNPLKDCYVAISSESHETLGHTRTASDGRYRVKVRSAEHYKVWACKGPGYLFRYIPQLKTSSGEPTDFRLEPGANIVIAAYDEQGRRLDNGAFRGSVEPRVFLTDLSDMPAEGYFGAVHHAGSDWRWDRAHPAAIVRPGQRYKLFVRWQFAGIGDLLYALDNEGEGYRIDGAGAGLEINLNREVARSALAALRSHPRAGAVEQAVRRSASDLQRGEAALAQSPPDMPSAVRHFRQSLETSLNAQEAAELALARDNIEKNRKGELELQLVGSDGMPLSGVRVQYRQIDSDFVFGAHPLGLRGSYDRRLAAMMKEAGINQSYVTVRWGQLESSSGRFNWHNMDQFQSLDEQLAAGFRLLGALSLWFSPNTDFSPSYLYNRPFLELRDRVYRFASQLAGRYADRIGAWELNELNLASANAIGLDWQQRLQVGREFVRAIRDADPDASILVGSTALPFEFPDSRPFTDVLRSDLTADMIGLEFYYAGVNTDGHAVPGLDIPMLSRFLDHYDGFGKPVFVKEFSAPSTQVPGSSWWKRRWDEDLQAEYVAKFYTIAFSKPMVRGITWSWGVADPDAWIVSGGLFDENMKPKKAYYALAELLRSWRSEGVGTASADGRLAIRGFAGDYHVVVESNDGRSFSTTLNIEERRQGKIAVSVRWGEHSSDASAPTVAGRQ